MSLSKMETSAFEAVKVAMKQDKNGYVLTLCIHPDEVPEEILRDFVGARYQVVVVRLTEDEQPMNREQELGRDSVRAAGILCRDQEFWRFLKEAGQVFEADEVSAIDWLKHELGVTSRSDIPKSQIAINKLIGIKQEFYLWKQENA
jgi:hypothetical protein